MGKQLQRKEHPIRDSMTGSQREIEASLQLPEDDWFDYGSEVRVPVTKAATLV